MAQGTSASLWRRAPQPRKPSRLAPRQYGGAANRAQRKKTVSQAGRRRRGTGAGRGAPLCGAGRDEAGPEPERWLVDRGGPPRACGAGYKTARPVVTADAGDCRPARRKDATCAEIDAFRRGPGSPAGGPAGG